MNARAIVLWLGHFYLCANSGCVYSQTSTKTDSGRYDLNELFNSGFARGVEQVQSAVFGRVAHAIDGLSEVIRKAGGPAHFGQA